MIYANARDQAVDDAAVASFIEAYGERATGLPPVAIVIAAYTEAGAIGYAPSHDLESGMATVWPDFKPEDR